MAIQKINIGNIVNDGLGDDLRTAFQKVNSNFSELQTALTINASNLANGAKIFKQKANNNLEFRTIFGEGGIIVEELTDAVRVTSLNTAGFTRIETQFGAIQAAGYPEIILTGGPDIRTSTNGGAQVVIDTRRIGGRSFYDVLTSIDFGPITSVYQNSIQFLISTGNYDFGTIDNPSSINYDAGPILT
jgi:hypothetical protein